MSDTNTNKGVLDAEENKVNLVKISACISQKIDTVIRDMAAISDRRTFGTIFRTSTVYGCRAGKENQTAMCCTRYTDIKCQDPMYKKYYIKMYN